MTTRDKIKPFVIVDYDLGAALHLYSVEDYKHELFDTRKDEGFTGCGYDWTELAELFIQDRMPDIADDIQFDPEYSMFTANADDSIILEAFGSAFKAALDDDFYILRLFNQLPPKK